MPAAAKHYVLKTTKSFVAHMLFSHRIRTKQLAGLCRRLWTSLGAGIDVRTAWAREAQRASGRAARDRMMAVSGAVNRGDSLADALAQTGGYFPPLMRELVDVGEQTGELSEVFGELAEHYEGHIEMRRTFMAAAAWPLIELGAAVVLIGCLIVALGIIEQITGNRLDPLGFGLVGLPGLAVYLAVLAGIGLVLFLTIRAVGRGMVWTRPIQRAVLCLPGVGGPLRTLVLARLAWTMHLTFKTGMEVRRALKLSLRSTRNARYTDHIGTIDAEIASGSSLHEAFVSAGVFPHDFLDALAVAEQSGRVTESMDLLWRQYHAHARIALATLNKIAAFAVWVAMAAIMVALIFRLALTYLGTINSVLEM